MTTPLSAVNSVSQPISGYAFPQVTRPLAQGERGIASITFAGRTLRFRTNPNEFAWTYTLNKKIDTTYGGRVVQLLSTKIDDFTIKADCGNGRWPYMFKIATFMRDIMVEQRTGRPATFEYTTRGWKLNVYIVSVPFADAVEEVARPFEINMKVQEDISGVMSRNSLSAELSRLQDGVGFSRSKYNDPRLNAASSDQEQSPFNAANLIGDIANAAGQASDILGYVNNNFLPNGLVGQNSTDNPNAGNTGG